jgi:FdhD protein
MQDQEHSTSEIEIIRYKEGRAARMQDTLIREQWLDLYLNGTLLLQTPVSSGKIEELIHGYLYVQGCLQPGQRLQLSRRGEAWRAELPEPVDKAGMKDLVDRAAARIESNEGITPLPEGPRIHADTLLALAAEFQRLPSLYHQTGGVHMAAIAAAGGPRILFFADDISRRNAVDKVIGTLALQGGGFERGILLISGRISADLAVRMLRTGIPLVVSKSAPTDKAVRIAEAYGITLCGFARGKRVNIYTHPERVEMGDI